MDKQVVFKTAAFGGFEKKAVMDYVYALTQRFEEIHATLEEQKAAIIHESEEIRRDLEAARAEAKLLKSSGDSVREELEGERKRILELTELVASQEEEIDRQKKLVGERSRQMDEYVRANTEVEEKYKGLEKTRREVEEASAQIVRLIIDAHADSDRIQREGQEKAGEIVAQASAKAEEILSDAGLQAQKAIADAEAEAKRMTEAAQQAIDAAYEKFSVFRTEVSNLQRQMLATLEEIHFKAAGISTAIDDAQDLMHHPAQALLHYEEDDPETVAEDDEPVAEEPDTEDTDIEEPDTEEPTEIPFFR
jgi:chromosome segregation ATPase